MKRVGLILSGAVVAAVLTAAVSFEVAGQGLALHLNAAQAAAKPVDPLAGSGGPVCVAVPIFSGGTKCPTGPGIEIDDGALQPLGQHLGTATTAGRGLIR